VLQHDLIRLLEFIVNSQYSRAVCSSANTMEKLIRSCQEKTPNINRSKNEQSIPLIPSRLNEMLRNRPAPVPTYLLTSAMEKPCLEASSNSLGKNPCRGISGREQSWCKTVKWSIILNLLSPFSRFTCYSPCLTCGGWPWIIARSELTNSTKKYSGGRGTRSGRILFVFVNWPE